MSLREMWLVKACMKWNLFILCLLIPTLSLANESYIYSSPYATHQHILKEIVNTTQGPIIEFGSGESSTDLLHELCMESKRLLITLDDDASWLDRYKTKYLGEGYEEDNTGWHRFYFVPGKYDHINPDHWIVFFNENQELLLLDYALCFVDQSPWLGRFETIKRFKDLAQYVILHDCNYYPEQGVFGKVITPLNRINHTEGEFDFSDEFPFFKVYYPDHPWPGDTGPPTLVGSMTENTFPSFD